MEVPSIKGTVISAIIDDLNDFVASGRVTRDWLESRLEPQDLEILETKVAPAIWYPIDSYDRLTRALVEIGGGADAEGYLRRRGEATADRLRESGLYAQLKANGTEGTLDLAQVKLTLSLWGAMVNFSRYTATQVSRDPVEFVVDVMDAEAFPKVLRTANAGFMQAVFSHIAGRPLRATVEAEEGDRFRYRIGE